MMYSNNFIYSSGAGDESGSALSNNNEVEKDIPKQTPEIKEKPKEDKTIIGKIRAALQDWSNKDNADQEFDDTRV